MTDDPLDQAVHDHYEDQELSPESLEGLMQMRPPARRGWTEKVALVLAAAAALVLSVPVWQSAENEVAAGSVVAEETENPASHPRLQEALQEQLAQLERCHATPTFIGTGEASAIEVMLTVKEQRARDIEVVENQTNDQPFADCVTRIVASWTFPKAPPTRLTLPVLFKGTDEVILADPAPGATERVERIIALDEIVPSTSPPIRIDPGNLENTQVKSVILRYAGQLKFCYESRIRSNHELSGRVEVGWAINRGKVEAVWILSNTTNDDALADCIVSKIEHWKFDPTISGDVSWPFVFQPSD